MDEFEVVLKQKLQPPGHLTFEFMIIVKLSQWIMISSTLEFLSIEIWVELPDTHTGANLFFLAARYWCSAFESILLAYEITLFPFSVRYDNIAPSPSVLASISTRKSQLKLGNSKVGGETRACLSLTTFSYPAPFLPFLCEPVQWTCYPNEAFDKPLVVGGYSKKLSELLHVILLHSLQFTSPTHFRYGRGNRTRHLCSKNTILCPFLVAHRLGQEACPDF